MRGWSNVVSRFHLAEQNTSFPLPSCWQRSRVSHRWRLMKCRWRGKAILWLDPYVSAETKRVDSSRRASSSLNDDFCRGKPRKSFSIEVRIARFEQRGHIGYLGWLTFDPISGIKVSRKVSRLLTINDSRDTREMIKITRFAWNFTTIRIFFQRPIVIRFIRFILNRCQYRIVYVSINYRNRHACNRRTKFIIPCHCSGQNWRAGRSIIVRVSRRTFV